MQHKLTDKRDLERGAEGTLRYKLLNTGDGPQIDRLSKEILGLLQTVWRKWKIESEEGIWV